MNKQIKILYAGGTFGCHGKPLSPISQDKFLPILRRVLNDNCKIEFIENNVIKDSSHLSTDDFYYYYQLINTELAKGYKKIIIITGTDTLSYLSSFLSECFTDTEATICLTASMHPLLHPQSEMYVVNDKSDALGNINQTIKTLNTDMSGVFVCVNDKTLVAHTVQKIYSQRTNAFTGKPIDITQEEISDACESNNNTTSAQAELSIEHHNNNFTIEPVYIYPAPVTQLEETLSNIFKKAQENNKISCVVLYGFGAGNIPYSKKIKEILHDMYDNNHLVFNTTQCNYDGVTDDYSAGSWLYDAHVISCYNLTSPHIFARIFWLTLFCQTAYEIRVQWHKRYINI